MGSGIDRSVLDRSDTGDGRRSSGQNAFGHRSDPLGRVRPFRKMKPAHRASLRDVYLLALGFTEVDVPTVQGKLASALLVEDCGLLGDAILVDAVRHTLARNRVD